MKKRIYKNKNYWIREAIKEGEKLPSMRLKELIQDKCWTTLIKEILIIKKIISQQRSQTNNQQNNCVTSWLLHVFVI